MALNIEGTDAFVAGNNLSALEKFAEAYRLTDHIPAFALNLLQSMVRQKISNYRGIHTVKLLENLEGMELSQTNQTRFDDIRKSINQTLSSFQVESFEPNADSTSVAT